jgi:hypothetical protein
MPPQRDCDFSSLQPWPDSRSAQLEQTKLGSQLRPAQFWVCMRTATSLEPSCLPPLLCLELLNRCEHVTRERVDGLQPFKDLPLNQGLLFRGIGEGGGQEV